MHPVRAVFPAERGESTYELARNSESGSSCSGSDIGKRSKVVKAVTVVQAVKVAP